MVGKMAVQQRATGCLNTLRSGANAFSFSGPVLHPSIHPQFILSSQAEPNKRLCEFLGARHRATVAISPFVFEVVAKCKPGGIFVFPCHVQNA